ncbi:tetratricopeptide repeat protein [Bradyrhizobium sp. STM 3809]|uniref:ATP-grasp domain-containing protein n=1 Tax=Bradyrhizobium sp. STM 3809 TaxID=551936 RepID=UPI0002409C69|nr:tetratricopeptide repeat protein [Bradyrhizobium sp. STM 3809]CCD98023.1 putative Tetratricopeptide TPR_4 [Bradyrhizobium sp. STM 3809]
MQEARLVDLDGLLGPHAVDGDLVDLFVERASLLAALGRMEDAKLAFIDVLRVLPTHFGALNEFGTFLTRIGAIAAACRVYAEAIGHHPDNPIAHVNLANLLLRASKYDEARSHYEAALECDPDNANAHQGLGAVLSDLGERAAARHHFAKGFRHHAISTLPYRGVKAPVALMQLVSSGGGNIPMASILDDSVFQISVVVADYLDPTSPLPVHDVILNTIGDADLCMPALRAARRLVKRTAVQVINDPRAIMTTGRVVNARRLRGIPALVTAETHSMRRAALAGPDGPAMIAKRGISFPLLLRSPGYHTGRHFVLVAEANGLAGAIARLPGDELLVIRYLDARGNDGNARKYRVMLIDGELFPLHLAISRDWKVHYFTSQTSENADHRREEAQFLEDMRGVLGHKAISALERVGQILGLDYAGVDFGINHNGDVLLFEANATMIVARPDLDDRFAYRHKAVDRIIEAVVRMIERKADIGRALMRG